VSAAAFRPVLLVPTYDNPKTVRAVVERARAHLADVLVVDDGSGPAGRAACEALAAAGLAEVVHRLENGGKGAAVKTGFAAAAARGFTHAVQVDADGQHDLGALGALVAAGAAHPGALVLGCPEYDASVPKGRLWARKITRFWVDREVGRGVIRDAMVGFRVYPLAAALSVEVRGDRMDFDVEIAVRLAWTGMPVINLPVRVVYPDAEAGGVSHFQPLRDNLRFSWLHSRLMTTKIFRGVVGFFGRLLRGRK
jgi:glycosyltransferase involved in cell wall biosynthesis